MITKTVAIVQSNYIPWKGYFDLINTADEFILLDDVQYTQRDWRNRNRIKTASGLLWLTIPVEVKGKYHQRIDETVISNSYWKKVHWRSILHSYSRARYFREYREIVEEAYLNSHERLLSQLNFRFLTMICSLLRIKTRLSWSTDYPHAGGRTERLVSLCKAVGATAYLSGPAAKGYIDDELFQAENIQLLYMDYSGYPEYEQLFPPFEHRVSILDLIFNVGPHARRYMKSFRNTYRLSEHERSTSSQ